MRKGQRSRTLGRIRRQETHLLPILLVFQFGLTPHPPHLLHLLLGQEERLQFDLVLVVWRRDRDRVLNQVRDQRVLVERVRRDRVVSLFGEVRLVPPFDVGRRRSPDFLRRLFEIALQSRLHTAFRDPALEVLHPRFRSERFTLLDVRSRLLEREPVAGVSATHVHLARHSRSSVREASVEERGLLERVGSRVSRGRRCGRSRGASWQASVCLRQPSKLQSEEEIEGR